MSHVINASKSHRRRMGGGHPCLEMAYGSQINFGDHASIQNLPGGADGLTVDLWFLSFSLLTRYFLLKAPSAQGFYFSHYITGGRAYPRVSIKYDTDSVLRNGKPVPIGIWHHVAFEWVEYTVSMWENGVRARSTADGAGNYQPDAGGDLTAMINLEGYAGWLRFSKAGRFSGVNVDVPPRWPPPAVDADTIEQWNFDDMTGATVSAQVNANNDGVITNGAWRRA